MLPFRQRITEFIRVSNGIREAIRSRTRPTPRSTSDVFVGRYLDLSTSQLSQAACADLNAFEGITAYQLTYGWLLSVPDPDEETDADEYGWPAELLPILRLAHAHDCHYILFDRDAGTTELLPTFDW